MRHSTTTTLLTLLASSALAEEISFFFPGGYEGTDPVATISTANPSTTAFRIACPTGVDSNECGWGIGMDYSIISSTRYEGSMTDDGFSMSVGCDYNSKKTEMTCTAQQTGGNDEEPEPVTAVISGSEVQFLTISVVEGASLLGGASASATATKKMSESAASATASAAVTGMTSGSSAGPKATASGKETTSEAPAEATGVAARYGIEGSALLVLAGAAALNVW